MKTIFTYTKMMFILVMMVISLYPQPSLERKIHGLALLNARVGGHIICHPDVTTDDRVVTNGDTSQDRSV